MLQLGDYRFQNLVDIAPPPGSTYVRAQTEPFDVVMELSEERLVNWLTHFGINEGNGHEPGHIHASRHAYGTEIQQMVDKIEPGVLVPVHTEKPELFENASEEVVVPREGVEISI